MIEQLSDVPQLEDEINDIKAPSHEALIQLIIQYNSTNSTVCKNDVHQRSKKQTEIEIGIGTMNFNYDYLPSSNRFMAYSLRAYFPFADRFMYYGLGLQYGRTTKQINKWDHKSYELFKFPVYIRYQYPGNVIKINISAGTKFYYIKESGFTTKEPVFIVDFIPTINIGVSAKLQKHIYLTLNIEQEFTGNYYNSNPSNSGFSNALYAGIIFGF